MIKSDKFIPTKEQLLGLHRLLNFMCDSNMEWHSISIRECKIMVKAEPPKGDIDIRIIYVLDNGRIDDDGFREQIQKFD